MPIIPNFFRDGDNTQAKIAWLKTEYDNPELLKTQIDSWDRNSRSFNTASYIILSISLILSGLRPIIRWSINDARTNEVTSHCQTAIIPLILCIAAILKHIGKNYQSATAVASGIYTDFHGDSNNFGSKNKVKSVAKNITTIPPYSYANDVQKIKWLQENFGNRSEFEATLNEWDLTVQRIHYAQLASMALGTMLVNISSSLESGIYVGNNGVVLKSNSTDWIDATSRETSIDFTARDILIVAHPAMHLIVAFINTVLYFVFRKQKADFLKIATERYNGKFFRDNDDKITWKNPPVNTDPKTPNEPYEGATDQTHPEEYEFTSPQ